VGNQDARYVEMKINDNWFEPPGNATGGDVARVAIGSAWVKSASQWCPSHPPTCCFWTLCWP